MPYLRISRARTSYTCASCSTAISRGQQYFRDEPHPFARMRNPDVAVTRHRCLQCVLGTEEATRLRESQIPAVGSAQLPLGFELTNNGFLKFPPRVEVLELSDKIIQLLAEDPQQLLELSPDRLELVVCNRLDVMGFHVERTGHTYRKDGGVDILAWHRSSPLPCLMAVQVKHSRDQAKKVGPSAIRDLAGVVSAHGFNAGLIVTNTTFSPDAEWYAQQRPMLTRLRDMKDLQRWLREDYLRERDWRELPSEIELCPGVIIKLPK